MPKLDLSTLESAASAEKKRLAGYRGLLMVCAGTGCVSAKSFSIRDALCEKLAARGLDKDYLVVATGCNGFCGQGPVMVVQPDEIFYQKLKAADVEQIVEEHLVGGKPVESLMFADPATGNPRPRLSDIPFFSKQHLIALRNKGLVDPERLDAYLARGGYTALAKALAEMTPAGVLDQVKRSGLRGRGGGGFPTGVKWQSCIEAVEKRGVPPVVVCNADEGDPGAFMDRSIIETDPHTVLEGILLAAYAVGAAEGYVYIRKEYPLALGRLEKAMADARERGLLGEKILGSDFSFDLAIHRGAGAFVCGESTALMAAMTGRAGEPRAKYIHNVESGYKDRPTVLNNVESFANIPVIIERGGPWFSAIGTGDVSEDPWNGSSGTKVFSLVGQVKHTGLVEVPMGITLRELIFDVGGGVPEGRTFKAVQTGGPSGGCLPAALLDEPVDFDSLTRAGSMMGSGGMIVIDDSACMVDVAKYFTQFLKDESCGKCTPCREGTIALHALLERITEGKGDSATIDELESIARAMQVGSLCQLGATAGNPVRSTLRYFKDEYLAHVEKVTCPGGVCKALITFTITDACTGCLLCRKNCPSDAITGEKKALHVIDQEKCIKCGICRDVCNDDAVRVD